MTLSCALICVFDFFQSGNGLLKRSQSSHSLHRSSKKHKRKHRHTPTNSRPSSPHARPSRRASVSLPQRSTSEGHEGRRRPLSQETWTQESSVSPASSRDRTRRAAFSLSGTQPGDGRFLNARRATVGTVVRGHAASATSLERRSIALFQEARLTSVTQKTFWEDIAEAPLQPVARMSIPLHPDSQGVSVYFHVSCSAVGLRLLVVCGKLVCTIIIVSLFT